MKKSTELILQNLVDRYPSLKNLPLIEAVNEIIDCYRRRNKLLICGNGGSAADALHIVGELMKGFLLPRELDEEKRYKIMEKFPESAEYLIKNLQKPLPALSLVSEVALATAYANDQAADLSFAQQLLGYGNEGDILLAISTSGNSKNVIYAAQIAKVQGMKVISLTGSSGGELKKISDVLLNAPSEETFIIQEYHLPIYHSICAAVENEFFCEERV